MLVSMLLAEDVVMRMARTAGSTFCGVGSAPLDSRAELTKPSEAFDTGERLSPGRR